MIQPNSVSTKQLAIVVFLCFLGTSSHVWGQDDLVTPYSSKQKGVTVRLEKVVVERVLNSSAFLEAEIKERNAAAGIQERLKPHLPARLVTFYISVEGETKGLGPFKVDFALEDKVVSSTSRFFSPAKWASRLSRLNVSPEAQGIETQYLLKGDTDLSDIFPAKVEVKITSADDEELQFSFDRVDF